MRHRRRRATRRNQAAVGSGGLRFTAQCTRRDAFAVGGFCVAVLVLLTLMLSHASTGHTFEVRVVRGVNDVVDAHRQALRPVKPWVPSRGVRLSPERQAWELDRRKSKLAAAERAADRAMNESAHATRFGGWARWFRTAPPPPQAGLRPLRNATLNATNASNDTNASSLSTTTTAAELLRRRQRKQRQTGVARTRAQIAQDEAEKTALEVQRQLVLRAFDTVPRHSFNATPTRYIDPSAPVTLCFLHIPRTAGSIVKRLLLRWAKREHFAAAGHMDDVLAMAPALQRKLRAVWGYRGYGLHRQPEFVRPLLASSSLPRHRVVYFGLFREPIARLVSQFEHRAGTNVTFLQWFASERVEDPASPWFASGNPMVRQMCCWWTPFAGHALGTWSVDGDPMPSGQRGRHEECTPSDAVLQCAMDNVEKFVAVGLASDISDAVDRLSYALGIPNVMHVASADAPEKQTPLYELSDRERATAVQHSKWDIRLYSFAAEVARRQQHAANFAVDFDDEVDRLRSGKAPTQWHDSGLFAPSEDEEEEAAGAGAAPEHVQLAVEMGYPFEEKAAAAKVERGGTIGDLFGVDAFGRTNLSNVSGWTFPGKGFNATAMALVDAAKTTHTVASQKSIDVEEDTLRTTFVATLRKRGLDRQFLLCFLHVPRTAGVVLQKMLRRWSRRYAHRVAEHLDDVLAKSAPEQLALRAIWGHRGFGIQRQPGFYGLQTQHGGSPRDIEYFALFRDPVARIVSQFERRVRKSGRLGQMNASFLEWFATEREDLTTSPWHAKGNPVVRQMCCWWTPFKGHVLSTWSIDKEDVRKAGTIRQHEDCFPSEKVLQCAKANVERFVVVGLTSNVQSAVDRLSYAFGIPNIGHVGRGWRNVRGAARPFYTLTDYERNIVVKRSSYDVRFFHYVKQIAARQTAAASRLPDFEETVRRLRESK